MGPRPVGAIALAALALVGAVPAHSAGLRDAQLAGQRIVTAFRGTALTPSLAGRIRHGEIAGVILFAGNIRSIDQARRLVADIRAVPRPRGLRAPLLVMVDQEGGTVRRVPGGPASAASAASDAQAREAGRQAGRLLRAIGADVNLAPVADVGRPGGFLAGQRRTYGPDPAVAAGRAVAFAAGLREVGVMACAKHFPGLGSARVNTDLAPSAVTVPLDELRTVDEVPFQSLVDAGVPLVMVASASVPALAPGPAALSRVVVRDELRGRLGFRGVTITDSLNAGALTRVGGPGPAAVRAAAAGVDLMLVTSERAATDVQLRLIRAYRTGNLDRRPARNSVARILALRATAGAGNPG